MSFELDGYAPDWKALVKARRSRRAHAAAVGTGPAGETCGRCRHLVVTGGANAYFKCGLINWTNGAATDIRKKDAACRLFEAKA